MTTASPDIDQARWHAVRTYSRIAGDDFVYAVTSTGIYCLPTCRARRPRRENVRFFTSAQEARKAGFRACLRCALDNAGDRHVGLVLEAIEQIEASAQPTLPVDELAARVGTSPSTLRRGFLAATGITPRQYADSVRRRRLRASLREGTLVSDAQYGAGYGSGSRLYEAAQAILGTTPARYGNGAPGVAIRYATAQGPLGPYLAAATDHGICHVALGPERTLVGELRREFPRAELDEDDTLLRQALEAMRDLLERRAPDARLPMDVRATAFQRQVWEYVRGIPAGETRTYGEVASGVGRPSATRAVARACGSNPLALLTPCHRVIAADGALAGYRWGVGLKGALLAREQANEDSSP